MYPAVFPGQASAQPAFDEAVLGPWLTAGRASRGLEQRATFTWSRLSLSISQEATVWKTDLPPFSKLNRGGDHPSKKIGIHSVCFTYGSIRLTLHSDMGLRTARGRSVISLGYMLIRGSVD